VVREVLEGQPAASGELRLPIARAEGSGGRRAAAEDGQAGSFGGAVRERIIAYRVEGLGRADQGESLGAQLLVDDITEERHLAQVAQVRTKLEALGQFAATTIHDVKNITFGLPSAVRRLQRQLPETSDRDAPDLEELAKGVERINELVVRPLDFLRGGGPRLEPVDLRDLIPSALGSMGLEKVSVRLDPWEDVPSIALDPGQFRRVIENLTFNAVRAMEGEGELRVGVSRPSTDHLLVELADTGPGIPAERIDNLFEPFSSSGEGGHGLGLAIVLEIVSAHGGRIEVDSRPGDGANFKIPLPVSS